MRIEQFFIGLLIFSLFMIGGSMIFYNTMIEYDVNPNMTNFNGSYKDNTTGGVYNILDDMHDDIAVEGDARLLGNESISVGLGGTDASESLFAGAFRVLKLIPNSYKLVDAIMKDILSTIGLPAFFSTFFSAIFIITIIFAVIYLILRMRN